MMNDELVWALRHCTDETVKVCPPCPYFAWDKQKDNEGCMTERIHTTHIFLRLMRTMYSM